MNTSKLRRALCAVLVAIAAPATMAWTDKPVRLIVPAPAGGTIDMVARILADQLSTDIGQPVVIDNKPGAAGGIGVQALKAAPADGQTILMITSGVLTENPHVVKAGFDPLKDVKPVAAISRAALVLVGRPDLPAKDLKGLITYLKANPGKLSFATYSAGTASHYAGELLNQKAGLDLTHVPFAGSPPALTQVMGGHIAIMFDGVVTSKPMIESGKLKAFGVPGKTRLPQLPDVPTFAEQGYPDLVGDFSNWQGVVVSSSVPNDIAAKIYAAVTGAAERPKVRGRLVAAGFEPIISPGMAELNQSVRSDFERNGALVKSFHIGLNQ